MKKYKKLFEVKKLSRNNYIKISSDSCDYSSRLLETTFDIDKDVKLLYNKSILSQFAKFYNNFKKGKLDNDFLKKIRKMKKGYIIQKFNSSIFVSKDAKKSNLTNPIEIEIGIFEGGSSYDPISKKIEINIHYKIINFLRFAEYGFEAFRMMLDPRDFSTMEFEGSDIGFKTRISHELSHWISDSLHNKHIERLVTLSIKLNKEIINILEQKNVDMTYFEIDAQVHAIKQLNIEKKKEWDKMTTNDLFNEYLRLTGIYKEIFRNYGRVIAGIWIKNLMKRLEREKLLGKNMKQFPNVNKLLNQSKIY